MLGNAPTAQFTISSVQVASQTASSGGTSVGVAFSKRLGSGFFGGEGFVLQGLTGDGDVFLKAGGTLIRHDLEEGEELRISTGCLVGFSHGIDYGT